jgi:hypothetical protein
MQHILRVRLSVHIRRMVFVICGSDISNLVDICVLRIL